MAFAMTVDFHPEATAELAESADWYAEHSSAASRNFLVAVDVAVASIVSDPKRFVHIDERHQACSVIKFPFQIVYRNDGHRIIVIALHAPTKC